MIAASTRGAGRGRRSPRRRIGVLVFDQVKTLDFVGPAEVFLEANQRIDSYEIVLISPDGGDITTSMGMRVGVSVSAAEAGELDTLVVPGSERALEVFTDPALLEAVSLLAARSKRIASICSGAFGLAALGLLDGRRAVTHWKFTERLAAGYPDVSVEADAIFIKDGNVFTSAGVAAGIDLALALVEDDLGPDDARAVAQLLLVYLRRSGGQSQFSASLRASAPRTPVARAIAEYVAADPSRPSSMRDLAAHANVSPRHLARVMREEFGTTPAAYVNSMRLDLATRYLESGASVARAAADAGYRSPDALRRAFTARLGVTPSEYQRRFRSAHRESGSEAAVLDLDSAGRLAPLRDEIEHASA
ncbi:GlxA family transcriptional regulator [Herbiconiux liangxiaofengii]|uniref:GlxA family transcriptional regulator n=1 Tax=Herbiconiux liangxiaofengii TaxID=3342795 RepID=UPI0035BAE719